MIEIYSAHICQFVEAASHHILSKRCLYPHGIFVSRLAFGVPIKVSIHPEVNRFIEDSLDGLASALDARNSEVEGIDMLIIDYDGDLVEKYAFKFGCVKIRPKDRNVVADQELRPVNASPETVQLLKTALSKLTLRINDVGPILNAKGCHFNFKIHANEQGAKAVLDNHAESMPWESENCSDVILDFIAEHVPVLSVKENDYGFSIHIDSYNKDMQN